MTGPRLAWAAAVVMIATAARAAQPCAARSGALFVRDTCRKHETPIDAAPFGATLPQGPRGATGMTGSPGPARGSAHVGNDVTFAGTPEHFTAVTRPQTGVFCLVPDDSIDAAASLALATAEYGYSAGSELVVYVRFPVSICAEGTFEVHTVNTAGTPSDEVAFHFVVI